MNEIKPNKVDVVYAGEEEEFFYKSSNLVVSCGDEIGVDVEQGDLVHLVLFDNIYWKPANE